MNGASLRDPLAWLKRPLYRFVSRRYMDGCSHYNSLAVRRASRSKRQARQRFAELGIPHAEGLVFINPLKAVGFARQHGFPLVIKPNVSGYSRGSHFPLRNWREFWRGLLLARLWWPSSVIEGYLAGANYRIVATPDDVVSVLRRYPAFVDGNGRDSIAALVAQENAVRESMGLYPVMYPLQLDAAATRYLRQQGLDTQSVPAADERIELGSRVALASGGIVETIDRATIPEANLELFRRIVQGFDARIFGIDAIFEHGIEKNWSQQRCIFLEVNSRPYLKMHDYPRNGIVDDLEAMHAALSAEPIEGSDTF